MFASSGQRSWIRRAIAFGFASLVCGAWPESGFADTGMRFPATSAYHRRNYDPFDEPAPQAVETAVNSASASVAAVEHGDFHEPILQSPFDDPFDRLPPVANSAMTTCALLASAPTQVESLPSPPSANEEEHSEEEAGSTWSAKPVCELTTDIVLPGGLLPKNHWDDRPTQFVACGDAFGTTRGWPVNTFTWVASCLCHNPLYFEEINLERYGYGCGIYGPCCSNCLQSAVSACHFFGTVPSLPYEMAVDCPCECDFALGYYRPGSCPPWRYNCCSRVSCLGTLATGGVATGLIFLIP